MGTIKFSDTISDVSNIDYSDMAQSDGTGYSDFFSVGSKDTDGPSAQAPTTYQPNFSKWHGYYRKVPEFRGVVDKITEWVFGNGYEEGKELEKVKNLKGWGKDDFLEIQKNQLRTALIAGDSFAEIIKDKSGRLINLKPINPGSMRIEVGVNGLLTGYTQTAQVPGGMEISFEVDEIFHLSWNRIADEIHGIPLGEALEDLMKMRNENMFDQKVFYHRFIQPVMIIPVDTENTSELAKLKAQWKEANKKGEVMFVGRDTFDTMNMKNALGDLPSIDQMPWLKFLIRQFVTGSGVPEIVMGWGEGTTEAGSKIVMVAWENTVKVIQRWNEKQNKLQLNLKLKLNDPPTINPQEVEGPGSSDAKINSPISDDKKDGNGITIKPGANTK